MNRTRILYIISKVKHRLNVMKHLINIFIMFYQLRKDTWRLALPFFYEFVETKKIKLNSNLFCVAYSNCRIIKFDLFLKVTSLIQ